MKRIEVAAAILVNDGKILCVKRGVAQYDYVSFHYEFPGGKLEPGEGAREALHRELIEELRLDFPTDQMEEFQVVHHRYPDFEITLHTFLCPVKNPRMQMMEHIDFQWLAAERLDELEWLAADAPLVEALMKTNRIPGNIQRHEEASALEALVKRNDL